MKYHLTTLFFLLLLNFCIGLQPADKGANAKTKATLDFMGGLPKQGKYLSGQFAGWSKVNFNWSDIIALQNVTGHIPAIIGCDYIPGWAFATPPQKLVDYSCNEFLKDHANKHGLVTIDTHFPNPSFPNGGGLRNKSNLVFTDLLKPETETGQRWRSYLDLVAEGLNDLQQANVTVLYRPLHEMNDGWCWWCRQDSSEYKSVWQSLFNYFSIEKNLHNLLWVYAPDQSTGNRTLYYPGDDYVDFVVLDVYVNNPNMTQGYDEVIKLNKPFGFGELGAGTPNGSFDYGLWPPAIQSHFNLLTYFHAWYEEFSPIRNKGAYALLNNEHVLNRDQILI